MIFHITPVPKPRMTKRDRWAKRPAVKRYWLFCEKVREAGVVVESGASVVFHMPMPESWSKKKRGEKKGAPHKNTPDLDNLCKALLDAIYDDDKEVWQLTIEKRWAEKGMIEVKK